MDKYKTIIQKRNKYKYTNELYPPYLERQNSQEGGTPNSLNEKTFHPENSIMVFNASQGMSVESASQSARCGHSTSLGQPQGAHVWQEAQLWPPEGVPCVATLEFNGVRFDARPEELSSLGFL